MLTKIKEKFLNEGKIILSIKATPKSGEQKIVKILDDGTIKIKLRSAPEHNKANQELVQFLSEIFQTSEKKVKILSGRTSLLKLIEISM